MTKISLLPALPGAVLGTDQFPVVRSGVNYRVAADAIKAFVNTDPSVVPSSNPWRGALVRRTSDATGLTWPYVAAFQEAVLDSDAFWSVGQPTRLTVPAGITKVRISAFVNFEALTTAGSVFCGINRNGAGLGPVGVSASVRHGATGFSNNGNNIISPVVEVVAGDFFELSCNVSMSGQDQVRAGTWMMLEVIEAA